MPLFHFTLCLSEVERMEVTGLVLVVTGMMETIKDTYSSASREDFDGGQKKKSISMIL